MRSDSSEISDSGEKCSEQTSELGIADPIAFFPDMTRSLVRFCRLQLQPDGVDCSTPSLVLVTQGFAGGLVDKVHPGAGWAGHCLIAIRSLSRRLVGQPNLNVHPSLPAPKDEIGHRYRMAEPSPGALTYLKAALSSEGAFG